jgi:uncharacterized protein (DUF427 family)
VKIPHAPNLFTYLQSLKPFDVPKDRHMTINEIHRRLTARVEGRKAEIADTNSATHLIRHALGTFYHWNPAGISHQACPW